MNPYGASHQSPTRIIIHSMGEIIQGLSAEDFLLKIKLSAHALITPSGECIRPREDTQGAYHAKGFNTNSLGMEFLVPGEHTYSSFLKAIKNPYLTDEAYQAGLLQVREWMENFNITQIDRHSDVDPGRKKDPGDGLPWEQFLTDLSRRQ